MIEFESSSILSSLTRKLEVELGFGTCLHTAITSLLNIIGYTQLYGKKNCDEALHFHQQALTMLETYYPSYVGHIASTLNYIGFVFSKQQKNDEALDMYHRALKMQEDYYLSDYVDIVSILRNIDNTVEDQEMDDEVVKPIDFDISAVIE
jgi:tetratricopeptide (TPR) repeat protein